MSREVLQQALEVLKGCLEHPDAQDSIIAIEHELAQPDNTAKLYEELRVLIDGGSESFTHKDAVQYLKDNLAPLKWTPEDTAYRPGGLAQPDHPEQMARLGWQYVECPACGSEGARAFPKPEQEPVAWMSNKDFEPIRIRIMREAYELADRNDSEGYNAIKVMCGDVQEMLPPQRQPLRGEQIYEIFVKTLPKLTLGMTYVPEWAIPIARAIEAAHGIGDKT